MTTRTSELTHLPAGAWEIDPAHVAVEFAVRHMMARTRGRFGRVSGRLTVGPDADARIAVEIDAASIDTNNTERDRHLRSADFLDVERYPTLTFVGRPARIEEDGRFDVVGELKIHGATKEITLAAEFLGWAADPWGSDRASFTAQGEIDRYDFGVDFNLPFDTSRALLGRTVRLTIEVELVRTAEPGSSTSA